MYGCGLYLFTLSLPKGSPLQEWAPVPAGRIYANSAPRVLLRYIHCILLTLPGIHSVVCSTRLGGNILC